jgi:hypothetical protein
MIIKKILSMKLKIKKRMQLKEKIGEMKNKKTELKKRRRVASPKKQSKF